jgi:F-box protein 23
VFLGLIFFLELTTGILAFVFKDWIRDQLNLFINNNVKAYRDDIDLQNLIDFAQEYVSAASSTGHLQEIPDRHPDQAGPREGT